VAEDQRPIIVVRKKAAHHGHHGGAWKVAYADFVTAMMAFFMVLWLMNSSEQIKEAVGAYFRDPTGRGKMSGSSVAGSGAGISVSKSDMGQLKDKLQGAMSRMPEFQKLKDQVAMSVTGEGLRVEMLETERGMFFESGSPKPSAMGEELLILLARELSQLPNQLLIEGHTDAKPYVSNTQYSNWELSTERANSARRLMESNGLKLGQVDEVRGYADRHLRMANDPTNPGNRRVSVIVKYLPQETPKEQQADSGRAAPTAEKKSVETSHHASTAEKKAAAH
jgi:chemotaxis protein MotB